MISFTKGLFIELTIRVNRMLSELEKKKIEGHNVDEKFFSDTLKMLSKLKEEIITYIQLPYLNLEVFGLNNLVKFNTYYERFQCIELFRFLVIQYYGESEIRFKKRIMKIYEQINCLQNPPLITTISNSENYYWAYPSYDVIAVPYGEDNHLLNLPDLYHEIAHLIFRQYSGFFQNGIEIQINSYYDELIQQVNDNQLDKHLIDEYTNWRNYWLKGWLEEYCCDMIATFLVGPAFAWTNVKMATFSSSQERVYSVHITHPSDESRMRSIFFMLEKMGYMSEMVNIKKSWNKFLKITQNPIPRNYDFIFPDKIIEQLSENVHKACQQVDLRSYTDQLVSFINPISKILNDAWDEILSHPDTFPEWESQQLDLIDKEQ